MQQTREELPSQPRALCSAMYSDYFKPLSLEMASYPALTDAARLIISIQLESSITFLLQCVWGIEAQNCKIFSSRGLLQGGFNMTLGRSCYTQKRCRTPSKEFISPTSNTACFQFSFLYSSTGKGTAAGLRLIHIRITGGLIWLCKNLDY